MNTKTKRQSSKIRLVDSIVASFAASNKNALDLEEIYSGIIKYSSVSALSGDWKAAARKELQAFNPDSPSYRRNIDLFKSPSRGVWELRNGIPDGFLRLNIDNENA